MVNSVLVRFGGLLFSVLLVAVCGLPTTAVAQDLDHLCEIAVEAREVQAVFEEYYACTAPLDNAWLEKYPKEVVQLERLYQAWKAGRKHDLRHEEAAEAWMKKYPVRFTARDVALSAAQAKQGRAVVGGDPVQVSGAFERLFVERDKRRLFLTSEEEGLVSISIAKRYAFTLEGKVGVGGARDFFVYNSKTAFVEELNPADGDRDLVVLDISNRAQPKEVARLKGAIPAVSWRREPQEQGPPSFYEYLQIREGGYAAGCWPRGASTYPIQCRPDGTCYKEEEKRFLDEGVSCLRGASYVQGSGLGLSRTGIRSAGKVDGGGLGRVAQKDKKEHEVSSEGGAGGAGALSQMAIYGSTLYVLSGSEDMNVGWLTTFDVSKPRKPRLRHLIGMGNSPEALQRHDNLLLIAGRGGIVTASLGVPASPRLVGEMEGCSASRDPIVVQGSLGYRTIIVEGRGRGCTSGLEVIDLRFPDRPTFVDAIPLRQPRGLAVLGARLFVADEQDGIVLFDLTDPRKPELVWTWDMPGVKDLVLSGFDLYAMSADEIQTFYVGGLYRRGVDLAKEHEVHEEVVGVPTVVRKRAEESVSTVAVP